MSRIKLIYAVSLDGFIGKKGIIPWYLPEDFKRFKALTMDQAVLMGRKTWESLPSRPLTGRRNIVVTSSDNYANFPRVTMLADSVEKHIAFHKAGASNMDLWVIGGEKVYAAALPFADEVYETLVNKIINGDAKAPTVHALKAAGFVREVSLNEHWEISASGERYFFTKWHKNVAA